MKSKTNNYILDVFDLPIFDDIYSLAECIGVSPALVYILSQENNYKYYTSFEIPKRNGKPRTIFAPSYSMKIIQRWILEEILYKLPVPEYAFGFKKGISAPLKQNALKHQNNLFILKMDLKDFFPSIDREQIYYLFSRVGYNSTISNILANITTVHEFLPQGAVTSPCIANLVCTHLDKRIAKYCSKREIIYTRYADDLTFSSNDKILLKSIYGMTKKIIEDEGFQLNENKTRLMTPKGKKTITGITVNNQLIKAPKEMKRKVRAMIHHAIVTGNYDASQQIRGYIAYISSIEDDYLASIKKYINSFASKSVCMFPEVVNAYNQNKFFTDLVDYKEQSSENFVEEKDSGEYEGIIYFERRDYLKKQGVIESETLVEQYDELPF